MNDVPGQATNNGDGGHPPTIFVYQNAEHVAGILQQIYGQPLITDGSREFKADQVDSSGSTRKGAAQATAKANLPGIGGVAANLGGDLTGTASSATTAGKKSMQNFVYSQAYICTRFGIGYEMAVNSKTFPASLMSRNCPSVTLSNIRRLLWPTN